MANLVHQAPPTVSTMMSGAMTRVAERLRRWKWGLMLIVPYVIAVSVFSLGPALIAVVFSFSKFTGGKPQLFQAGLGNYIAVFTDKAFLNSYWNVFRFSLLATTSGFVGSVSIALLLTLTRDTVGGVARSVFFLPGSINGPALALMFLFVLDPGISPFRFLFHAVGWEKLTDFVTPATSIQAMAAVRFYLMAGGWIAIFCAGLESVSQELIEAAKIDGCGPWRLAWYIRRPQITGFVWFMVIQLIASNLMIFGEPYLISQAMGGASFIGPFWSPNMVGGFYTHTLGNFGMSSVVAISQIIISATSSVFIVTKTGAFITDATS